MPTMKEHYAALRAASEAGDQEAVAYIRQQVVAEQQGMDRAEYNPTTGQSALRTGVEGVGRGISNIARNVGNMTGFVSDDEMTDASQLDSALMDTTAGKVGNFIGETAAVTLPTMGTAGLVGRAAGVAGGIARNAVGRGVIEGAVQGAITAGPDNRTAGGILGGAVGGVIPGAGTAYRALRSGVNPSASAQRLMRDGVSLTPGQMNPQGALNQIEEVAQAVPYLGNIVSGARQKGYQEFQHRVAQDVAPPGVSIRANADVARMMDDLSKSYNTAYDVVKGFPVSPVIMRTQGGDIPLGHAFKKATTFRGTVASDQERKAADGFLSNQMSKMKGRQNSSDDLISLRSEIRAKVRDKKGKDGWDGFVEILSNADKKVTDALDSQLPPAASKALKDTDAQYGKFKVLEDAVYKAKDQSGSFTPAQFSQAVRDATGKAEYAKGGGRMRDLSRSANDVFQPKQPLTGRQAVTAAPLIAAAYAFPGAVGIPAAASLAALYGTKAGRNFAAGQTAVQQGARQVEREIRRKVPKTARELTAGYSRNALVNYTGD
jgi:hypothetical protein